MNPSYPDGSASGRGLPNVTAYRPGVLVMVSSMKIGGAEKHAIALANHLDRDRFRAGICFLKSGGTLTSELDRETVEFVLPLGVKNKFDWSAIIALARYIDRHSIDIVVCTNGYPLVYARLASWMSQRSVHLVEVFHTTGMRTPIKSRARSLVNWIIFRQCELLVYVSHLQRKFWRARWFRARRDVVIHNGIDTEHFTDRYTSQRKAELRAGYGFAADDYVIGICASLRREKAHLDLLQAIKNLRDSGSSARLLIIGDGEERSRIEQKITEWGLQGAVAITGFHADVRPLIACCDVMTLTSHTVETFSIAALESMSMSKPMVLSRVGGAEEQVTPGVTGFLFNPGDIAELTEHLHTLSDPQRRKEMGEAASRVVKEHFTTQKMVSAFTREFLMLTPPPVTIGRVVPN